MAKIYRDERDRSYVHHLTPPPRFVSLESQRGPLRIRPTICTNRPISVTEPAMTALAECGLGSETMIVVSGMTDREAGALIAEVRRILPDGEIIVEPKSGLSRARNAALGAVEPDDVVAYVDDDAVISDTWADAMTRKWSSAEEHVAAVGGPIKPLFLTPRPRWLSDALLGGLSILDNGSHELALDGRSQLLYGANLSVRARHASSVGGFDVRRGPLGYGPGFGDDIEFQHRLADAGFTILYDPEAWVSHRIAEARLTRRGMLRRRYAQGREIARSSAFESLAVTARTLCTSHLRAAFLAVAGRPADSMDHLAYGVQCAGIIGGCLRTKLRGADH